MMVYGLYGNVADDLRPKATGRGSRPGGSIDPADHGDADVETILEAEHNSLGDE
jgi:hypothetical protein